MHRYVVASRQPESRCIALCDSDGRFHVARATSEIPAVGTRLTGNQPALGFGLLLGEALDTVYRVTFEAVDCAPEQALPALASERPARKPEAKPAPDLPTTWLS